MDSGKESLKKRDFYLRQVLAFRDMEPVKVITGIRRCGKSSLLKLVQKQLLADGVPEGQILALNFESMQFRDWDDRSFYDYVANRINSISGKKMYLFFDEVQMVKGWQRTVNALRVDFACDIYLTGSNAYLLSSELATLLAGRYVEIKVQPLSFREFLDFHNFEIRSTKGGGSQGRQRVTTMDGEIVSLEDVLGLYMQFGGMPGLRETGLTVDRAKVLLDGIYSAVVVRDILERETNSHQRQITDASLLRKITLFLSDNIGSNVSLSSISNTLVSSKVLGGRNYLGKVAVQTVQSYVDALLQAFVFYEIKRFDIKGKDYLRTLGKYYIVDLGLRNFLLGERGRDYGHALENLVYFALLRRGYEVAVGKIGDKEIDFVAVRGGSRFYYQVALQMVDEATRNRELAALRMIPDNCFKAVICQYGSSGETEDGIKIINAAEFLLAD